jgi:hypothetical protein
MSFSSNFTRVTLGADPEVGGANAIFVEGRTDASNPPDAIHVVLPHGDQPRVTSVAAPGLVAWEVKFPDGNPPFNEGDEVFVVGIATRPAPQDPFVWEASFTLASRDFP